MRPLRSPSPPRCIRRPRDGKLENRSARLLARDASPSVHEDDDCLPHFLAGAKKAVVDPQLSTAVADDDRAIGGEPHPILRAEPQALKARPQLFGVARRLLIELESELVAVSQPPHSPIA